MSLFDMVTDLMGFVILVKAAIVLGGVIIIAAMGILAWRAIARLQK